MKKISSLLFVLFALCLASCSIEPKQISPTSVTFEEGDLADLVELVNAPCELSYEETDAEIPMQKFVLKAKLKLKEETPYLKDFKSEEIKFSYDNLGVILNDEAGKEVQDLKLAKESEEALKKLLKGKKGEMADVMFVATFHNSEEAPKWFEQVASFAAKDAGQVYPIVYNMDGSIGKYPIRMTLKEDANGDVYGAYYYKKMGSGNYLYLKGVRSGNHVVIDEYTASGNNSGYFSAKLNKKRFVGEFDALNFGTHYVFDIPVDASHETLDLSGIDFDNLETGWGTIEVAPTYAVSDEGNYDALLDKYEEYVDDYISYINNLADSDPSALADAARLMEDAQELQEELEKARGVMSASDLRRLERINNKMLVAAQNM